MTGLLWGALAFLVMLGATVLGDMVSEEARDRLDHLPHAVLRAAARRLPPGDRAGLHDENWLPELTYILKGSETRPVTRLATGTWYALGILATARRTARCLHQQEHQPRRGLHALAPLLGDALLPALVVGPPFALVLTGYALLAATGQPMTGPPQRGIPLPPSTLSYYQRAYEQAERQFQAHHNIALNEAGWGCLITGLALLGVFTLGMLTLAAWSGHRGSLVEDQDPRTAADPG